MPKNVVENVVRWTEKNNINGDVKDEYIRMARRYQHGDPLSLVDEYAITLIMDEMSRNNDKQ
ncbi:MAG: hypothetical protein JXA18_08150 [Chitinispirillaceae bacterium]|nr:hypothetical protein [Chitinispirillaceae bacterium]